MVPADSRRIPRAPRYSGYRYASRRFAYRTFTVCGVTFQTLPLATLLATARSYNPPEAGTSEVWALPRSLATTGGIIRLFSSPTGTKMFQFPAFASLQLTAGMTVLQTDGLSHSEIRGSGVICTSPRLIAAYHVLHRLWEPRHPPYALLCFLVLHLRRPVPSPRGGTGDVEYTFSSASAQQTRGSTLLSLFLS